MPLYGFVIEGIGQDTTYTKGVAFSYGKLTPHASSLYAWRESMERAPGDVSSMVDPETNTLRSGGQSFEIPASDRNAQALLFTQRNPLYSLSAAVTSSATSVTIVDASGSGVTSLANSVVFLGDEAIKLGTHAGSGTYTGCTRGFWATSAEAHVANTGVFTKNPHLHGRRVRLIEHDEETNTDTVRWRGIVNNIKQIGPKLSIMLESLLGANQRVQLNTNAPNYASQVEVTSAHNKYTGGNRAALRGTITPFTPRIAQNPTTNPPTFLQVDDSIVKATVTTNRYVELVEDIHPTWLFDRELEAPEETYRPERVHEVFVIDRGRGTITSAGRGYSSIDDLDPLPSQPFHPLAVVLAFLTSTGTGDNGDFDTLGEHWGCGWPVAGDAQMIDITSFTDEIAATPQLALDKLVLGYDGEPFYALGVIRDKILRLFGYFLTEDETGLIGVARLRMPTIDDFENAETITPLPKELPEYDARLDRNPGAVVALLDTLPWQKERRVTITEKNRSKTRARLVHVPTYEVDMGAIDSTRLDVPDGSADDLASRLMHRLALSVNDAPSIKVQVSDYRQDSNVTGYKQGSLYKLDSTLGGLQNAWLVDNTGVRTTDNDDVQFLGRLVGRIFHPENATYTLILLLTAWRAGQFIKLRAPSAVLASGSTTTVLQLDTTEYHGTTPGAVFAVGDEIEIFDTDGSKWVSSAVKSISSKTDTTLTLSTALAGAPSAGLIVRLADSDDYANDTIYTATERPYAYMADGTTKTLTDYSGSVSADLYGTAVMEHGFAVADSNAVFTGIDDDAVGESGGVAKPLDSWLEYTLRANEQIISEKGNQISWTPVVHNGGDYSSHTGHRPYASARWSDVLYLPWLMVPDLKTINTMIVARSACETGTSEGVTFRVELDKQTTLKGFPNTEGSTPEYQEFARSLTLEQAVKQQDISTLRLQLKSGFDTTVVDTSTDKLSAVEGSMGFTFSDSTFYQDTTGARPSSTALDLQCTKLAHYGLVDHLGPLGVDNGLCVVGPAYASSGNVTRHHLGYAQIRGVEIWQEFEDSSYLPDEMLRGGLPIYGEIESMHPLRVDRVYRRPRPFYIGPTGDVPGAPWPDDYTRRFARILGNASDTHVLEGNGWLTTENPNILCLLHVIPVHLGAGDFSTLDATEQASIATWDGWVTIDQLEDGDADWSSATSLGSSASEKTSLSLIHYPTVLDPRYPALATEALLDDGKWSFREGQLMERDTELVQLISLPVKTTHSVSTHRPCRVRVHLDHQSTEWGSDVNNTQAALQVTVVGATFWELPT